MSDEGWPDPPDGSSSDARLRAMAMQIHAAWQYDMDWLVAMMDSTDWLATGDRERLRLLVAKLRGEEDLGPDDDGS